MIRHRFVMIKNGLSMVKKNIRAYAFLSVTIILSFSALLGYMIFTDSNLFNEYKDIMSASPYISLVTADGEDAAISGKYSVLEDKLDNIPDTCYYSYINQQVYLSQISNTGSLACDFYVIPKNVWAFYYSSCNRLKLTDSMSVHLEKNQAVINQSLYQLIKSRENESGKLYIDIPVLTKGYGQVIYNFEVVGVCNDRNENSIYFDENGNVSGNVTVLASFDNFSDMELEAVNRNMLIYSRDMKTVSGWLRDLNLSNDTAYFVKTEAEEKIISKIEVKASVSIALLLLLGLNLYSSFSNALSERKFEIGVRRAIGAGGKHIISQFFIEGLIVMFANILISIALVISGVCIYKLYMYYVYNDSWVICISPYSLGIYFCCCIFLSLLFSIVFAYMTTRVEIVKFLKAE